MSIQVPLLVVEQRRISVMSEVGAGGTQYEVHRVARLPTENPDPI